MIANVKIVQVLLPKIALVAIALTNYIRTNAYYPVNKETKLKTLHNIWKHNNVLLNKKLMDLIINLIILI